VHLEVGGGGGIDRYKERGGKKGNSTRQTESGPGENSLRFEEREGQRKSLEGRGMLPGDGLGVRGPRAGEIRQIDGIGVVWGGGGRTGAST